MVDPGITNVKALGYYAVVTVDLRATREPVAKTRAVTDVSWPLEEAITHMTTVPILVAKNSPGMACVEAVQAAMLYLLDAEGDRAE